MQKQGHKLITVLWILLIFYSCSSGYCQEQGGQKLFDSLISKYPENKSLKDTREKLDMACRLVKLIKDGLESKQKQALADILESEILPEITGASQQDKQSSHMLAPPEHLYWTNLEFFASGIALEGFLQTESEFLQRYYELRMQSYIEQVTDVVTEVMVINPESSGVVCYSFILPLLYLREGDPAWERGDYLSDLIGQDNLAALSDFSLLSIERPRTAMAAAKCSKSQQKVFSAFQWGLSASEKCVEKHRPDLAERLLHLVIDEIAEQDKIVELKLKVAEGYSKCGDNPTAVRACEKIARDFADSPLYGKVMSSYFRYMARDFEAEKILAEIDTVIHEPRCSRYLPQLTYLKWWALRKTNQYDAAAELARKLIKNYSDNPAIAPVLLAHAADALANQRYEQCRKLLSNLTNNFPQTDSAKEAEKILNRLSKL